MWLQRARPDIALRTRCGCSLRVIHPGVPNRHDGPDFLGASVAIDGTLRRGDIEVHTRPEDWLRHGHGGDPRYARVVLHVCLYDGDFPAHIPGIVLASQLGRSFRAAWSDARDARTPHPCRRAGIPRHPDETARIATMAALLSARRFANKSRRLAQRFDVLARVAPEAASFRQLMYEAIARAAGYGGNEDLCESIARAVPLRTLLALPAPRRHAALAGAAPAAGNSSAVMPHNRLTRRLSWFAAFAPRLDDRTWWRELIDGVRHGTGDPTRFLGCFHIPEHRDNPGAARVAEIVINVLGPVLSLYARRHGDAALARAATALYFSTIPAPANSHTRSFRLVHGLATGTAEMQQGLIELTTEFCRTQQCRACLNARL
ncbi:MAG: DUF2851 family protein [Bacteroidota bacterium]|nr:DUF2851 family protein [Bacteroidota bacterium]